MGETPRGVCMIKIRTNKDEPQPRVYTWSEVKKDIGLFEPKTNKYGDFILMRGGGYRPLYIHQHSGSISDIGPMSDDVWANKKYIKSTKTLYMEISN
jgi:hypothetical protein